MKKIFWLIALIPLLLAGNEFSAADCNFKVIRRHSKEKLTLKQLAPGKFVSGDLTMTVEEKRLISGKEVKLTFSVPQNSKNLYLLEVSAAGRMAKPAKFFDGHQDNKLTKTTVKESIFDLFPMAIIHNAESYFGIGIAPETVYGYLKSTASPDGTLEYTTKVVVDKIKPQTVTFAIFRGEADFAWCNGIDAYQRSYPEYFRPADGVDQRIYGVGGYLTGNHITRNLEINVARYLSHTWEWTYCPWNRSGEWYIDKENWKPGDGYYWYDKYRDTTPCSWEDYHKYETYRYRQGNRQAAMLHYILLKDTWHELAERFPESLSVNEKLQQRPISHSSSRRDNKGFTRLTFAYGSGLADYLENELRKVVENYETSGISLDMANWEYNEYNEAQKRFAMGRAFDNNGNIYTPVSVANVPLQKFIHTLSRNGKRMAVYNNQAISEMVAHSVFYGDAVMFEGNVELAAENVLPLRLMAGKKPMAFWSEIGVHQRCRAIDWPKLRTQPNGVNRAYYQLAQYLLLYCVRYGATPMNWAVAFDSGKIFKPHLPLLIDLKRAGYQPISAVSGSDKLWFGRFGENAGTIITIANPQREAVQAKLKLHRKYLGSLAPTAVKGKLSSFTEDKDFFYLECTIAPKQYLVLRDKSWSKPVTPIWGKTADITGFFTLQDAQNQKRFSVLCVKDSEELFDYLDRYYPFVYASKKHGRGRFSRMVFQMDPQYNTCWPLRRSNRLSGKMIVIAPAASNPALRNRMSPQEQKIAAESPTGFIKKFPDLPILWIGGKDAAARRKAMETYLEMMDKKYFQ